MKNIENDMEIYKVGRINRPNMVSLNNQEYHVVLTAMHADHFADIFGSNPQHDVRALDALKILAKSVAILLPRKRNKYVAFGRHNRKVYNTFFKLEQNRLYLLSSYQCTRRQWIELYERYEQAQRVR